MKKITLLVILLSSLSSIPQNLDSQHAEKVSSIDNIIFNLYGVISGEKGEPRDWELMEYLFHPDAKLIPSGKNKEGVYKAHYITTQEYIEGSGKWLVENGFFEKELHRETEQFGNIAHVFSTYESYYSEKNEQPFMRGINSIQLLHDGNRWWIINIYWTNESSDNLIPKNYLPNPK